MDGNILDFSNLDGCMYIFYKDVKNIKKGVMGWYKGFLSWYIFNFYNFFFMFCFNEKL